MDGCGNGYLKAVCDYVHLREVRQSALAKAQRMAQEELDALGWAAQDLQGRRKSDPQKVRIAARLRRETTMTLEWIADGYVWERPRTSLPRCSVTTRNGQGVKKLCSDPHMTPILLRPLRERPPCSECDARIHT